MASCIVISGILFARYQLLRMKKRTINSSSGLINHTRLQIHKNCARNMFTIASFLKKGGEGVISRSLVTRHKSIGGNSMLQTIKFPAGITNLDTGLSDMHRKTFSHVG